MRNEIPKCIIIPGIDNELKNCITIDLPPIKTLIFLSIISWIIMICVAYGIYWFLNKQNQNLAPKYSYLMILFILIIAMLVVQLLRILLVKL